MTQQHGPLPDCVFIQQNQPTARPVVLTTASKEGRSKTTKAKKKANVGAKSKRTEVGTTDAGAAYRKKKTTSPTKQ